MSYMFEVYYRPPRDLPREEQMIAEVERLGGRLDCWENANGFTGICLTFEFDDLEAAESAVDALTQQGERILMGPHDYGD